MKYPQVKLKIPAKINLFLKVLDYDEEYQKHEIETLFHSVNLYDTITVALSNTNSIRCHSNVKIPRSINLAVRAAKLIEEIIDEKLSIKITLDKKIPLAAGLAGGSADAAGALLALNQLLNLNIQTEKLSVLASKLGSDIPFQLKSGTAIGVHFGDILQYVNLKNEYNFVLLSFDKQLHTPIIYKTFDEINTIVDNKVSVSDVLIGFIKGEKYLSNTIYNDLQLAAIKEFPYLQSVIDKTEKIGSMKSFVTGSGPTIVCLTQNKKEARDLATKVKDEKMCDNCFVVATANNFL